MLEKLMRPVTAFLVLVALTLPTDASAGFLSTLVGRAVVRGGAAAIEAERSVKTYGPDVLTVSQLSACLVSAKSIDATAADLTLKHTALAEHKTQLEVRAAAIEEARKRLNRSSQRAVNAFNENVRQSNEIVKNINTEKDVFNSLVDRHKDAITEYNKNCAKKYYDSDLALAQAEANAK